MSDFILNKIADNSELFVLSLIFFILFLSFLVVVFLNLYVCQKNEKISDRQKEILLLLDTQILFVMFFVCIMLAFFYGGAAIINQVNVINGFYHNMSSGLAMTFENSPSGIHLIVQDLPPSGHLSNLPFSH